MEVRVFQEFIPELDSGHWSVAFWKSWPLVLRVDETSGKGIVRALGALAADGRGQDKRLRGAPDLHSVTLSLDGLLVAPCRIPRLDPLRGYRTSATQHRVTEPA
jgi:hypothetical protein